MTENSNLPRVEKISFDGQVAWVKRPEATRSNSFVFFHKIVERVLPKVLRHTGALGGMDAIRDEAKRLTIFKDAGLPVPSILALTDDSLTLSSAGDQLREVLRQTSDATQRYQLLQQAMKSLSTVHNANLCHGRPFVKDMTLNDAGDMFWIDLEEDPCTRMSLKDAQARDVWLVLVSFTEFCEDPLKDLSSLLAFYTSQSRVEIDSNLRQLGKSLRPLRWIISSLRLRNLSRDVTGAYWAIRVLEKY